MKKTDKTKDTSAVQPAELLIGGEDAVNVSLAPSSISLEIQFETKDLYSTMLQGPLTNTLASIQPREKSLVIDRVANTASIEKDGMTIQVPEYEYLRDKLPAQVFTASTKMLLDMFVMRYTALHPADKTMSIALRDYMALRGLKDIKEARKQVNKDLQALGSMHISFNGREGNYNGFVLVQAESLHNGIITIQLSDVFATVLNRSTIMAYPEKSFALNIKRYPDAYSLLRKILELKNMNVGKVRENIVAVKTLLPYCDTIPTYDDIAASKDRHINRRIIDAFTARMNHVSELGLFSWEYCHSKGKPLADDELALSDYSSFISMYVLLTWHEYPDQTHRLETAAAKKAAAQLEAKKKVPRRKKKTDK